MLSPLYTCAARRDAAQLNKIEIKEVVHWLYTYATPQLAVRRRFFHLENFLILRKTARFFHCFPPSFHRYLDFPHVKYGSISLNYTLNYIQIQYIQIQYINWKIKCTQAHCEGINYWQIDDKIWCVSI